jgi:hypothetical protein
MSGMLINWRSRPPAEEENFTALKQCAKKFDKPRILPYNRRCKEVCNSGRRSIMPEKKKCAPQFNPPQHEIEAVARCILPAIQAYFESEEGQRAFAEWKARQNNSQNE